jgi:hypothetical protein
MIGWMQSHPPENNLCVHVCVVMGGGVGCVGREAFVLW